jgi:hypothetical protein
MNYAAEQRIRFIDVMLVVYAIVNRTALMEYFGISPAAATRDLTAYKKLYPGNMTYDEVSKSYIKAPGFKRAFP